MALGYGDVEHKISHRGKCQQCEKTKNSSLTAGSSNFELPFLLIYVEA